MAVKLKIKVALGGLFLFALLILVGAVSFYYFNRLTREASEMVKDNYETLNYAKDLLNAMDQVSTDSAKAFKAFDSDLASQENNITEPGEREMTASLRKKFIAWRHKPGDSSLLPAIRNDINKIMQINLEAIDKKNQVARASVDDAKTIITVILTVCILVGITFIFNFPSLVAGPVAKLTEGIKAIAEGNYRQRIHLNRNDEFGELATAFNNMAERLDEYEHSSLAKIMFEKQRAETVINSLQDASIGMDMQGNILFANQQALQLLNLKESDLVGKKSEAVSQQNDLFRFLMQNSNGAPFKIVVEGKENYFTREIMDITQDQKPSGKVILLKNITPFKELDVAKTNFIATVSHELKTPLASSDFSLKLLENDKVGQLSAEQKELVHSLKQDNLRMLRILSELLDLSQVETGKMELNLQLVSVNDIVTKAELSVNNAAREKNINIKKEISPNIPPVQADPEKTVWILNNFLTNAIRYSAENSEIIIKADQVDNQFIEIGVQDFGIGVDPSFQKKIFDRFFRVPGTKDKKGSGLGLAISKDFAEAMGGTIGVKSQLAHGSYFFSRLKI